MLAFVIHIGNISDLIIFIKEIKNASECIVKLYKHAGIFKNTRESFLFLL